MWCGVTAGLASVKFSSSPKKMGAWRDKSMNKSEADITPNKSLEEKKTLKKIFPVLEESPKGFLEPVW